MDIDSRERLARVDSVIFATSVAIVGEGRYVLCRLARLIAPDAVVFPTLVSL